MPVPPKIKAGCGVVTIFSVGFLCGIVGIFLLLAFLIPRSEGWKNDNSKDFLASHLANKLKLSEAQKGKLRSGFDQYLNQRWQLRSDYLIEDRDMLEAYLSTVEPDLTAEQIKQMETIKQRWWNGKKKMVSEN